MTDLIQELKECGDDRQKWVAKLDKSAGIFTRGAVAAILGWLLSLKHGTPEMAVAYRRLAAWYGVFGCSLTVARKHLTGEMDLREYGRHI